MPHIWYFSEVSAPTAPQNTHITKVLASIAKLWISFPVSYLIYGAFVLGLSFEDFMKVLLSPFYWFTFSVAMLAGTGLLRIRWYGWYIFIFSNLLILYETASILTYYSHSENKLLGFLVTLAIQAIVLFLVAREVRVPYFFPKIRWWETDPRYKLSVGVQIHKKDGEKKEVEGEIMDISLGGCFIKTHTFFAQDEIVGITFNLFERTLNLDGMVVWRTESRVTHPKGVGVKFMPLTKEILLALKTATKKLQELNRVYNQMTRERNWQEYLQREQSFQGTQVEDNVKKK